MINVTFQNRFNSAAQLFSEGQIQQALEAYQSIFAPEQNAEVETPSEAFCLEIRMRIAFCFIELNEFADARCEFEAEATRNLLTFAGPAQLESYFFAYGNLLAKTGNYEAANTVLKQAQEIAFNELQETATVDRICRFRLHWANHYGEWTTLLELAQEFRALAQTQGLVGLMHWSSEAVCFALRGLHQYAEAKHGAEQICNRLQTAGARPDHVAVWEKFVADISA
jgi:tetratricopeptide (TPR) repeat protein